MTISIPPRPIHVSRKPMWMFKLLLRIVSLALSAALAGIAASFHTDQFISFLPLLIAAPSCFLGACWGFAEGVAIWVRVGHRGIYPGVSVAIDLLIMLLNGCVIGAGVFLSQYGVDISGSSSTSSYISMIPETTKLDYSSLTTPLKASGLLGISSSRLFVHLILFIIACYETEVRRRISARGRAADKPVEAETGIVVTETPTQVFSPQPPAFQMPTAVMVPAHCQAVPVAAALPGYLQPSSPVTHAVEKSPSADTLMARG